MELFAEVALLRDLPEHHLKRGQVGAVVEVYAPEAVEVEFIDNEGYTYALTTIPTADLVQLYRRPLENVA